MGFLFSYGEKSKMKSSNIIKTIAQKLFPFILLFGIYLILHGHLSPGGGFQGGVVLGTAVILLFLSYGIEETENKIKIKYLSIVEESIILFFIFIGILGMSTGHFFLKNFLPLGRTGQILSGGYMPLLNFVIGIKVAAGIFGIFYILFKYRGEI